MFDEVVSRFEADALELLGAAVLHLLPPDDPARGTDPAGKAIARARHYYGD